MSTEVETMKCCNCGNPNEKEITFYQISYGQKLYFCFLRGFKNNPCYDKAFQIVTEEFDKILRSKQSEYGS